MGPFPFYVLFGVRPTPLNMVCNLYALSPPPTGLELATPLLALVELQTRHGHCTSRCPSVSLADITDSAIFKNVWLLNQPICLITLVKAVKRQTGFHNYTRIKNTLLEKKLNGRSRETEILHKLVHDTTYTQISSCFSDFCIVS